MGHGPRPMRPEPLQGRQAARLQGEAGRVAAEAQPVDPRPTPGQKRYPDFGWGQLAPRGTATGDAGPCLEVQLSQPTKATPACVQVARLGGLGGGRQKPTQHRAGAGEAGLVDGVVRRPPCREGAPRRRGEAEGGRARSQR